MICQKCGSQMNDNAAFCSKCGNVVKVSLKKPFVPVCGKAPEFGKQISTEDDLDPNYQKVDMAVGTLRWTFCILWIIESFKDNGIILAIIMSAMGIYLTSFAEKFVMSGYEHEHLRTELFKRVKYSSYIDTCDSEAIAYILKEPLSVRSIGVSIREECPFGNIIDFEYHGREYGAAFVTEGGSYFVIVCNNPNKDRYEKMCKDIPFIVYHIQDILKNL